MRQTEHSFVICAYQDSPYLAECIASLRTQSVSTQITMVTSTPSDYLAKLAAANDIPLYVNPGRGGITRDWNFALRVAKTKYVTIAHQDDVYDRDYVKHAIACLQKAKEPLIFFSDYAELREGKEVRQNALLLLKRLLLFPLRSPRLWNVKKAQWLALAFGNGICCPSVTYVMPHLPKPLFYHHFRSNEDWEAWERLYRMPGAFVYCPKVLMSHRIHAGSETSKIIADHERTKEDYRMFRKFWGRPLAALLTRCYAVGQESNTLR